MSRESSPSGKVVHRTLSRILGSGVQAFTFLYLARVLGPVDFGHLSVLIAGGLVTTSLFGFGATTRILPLAAAPEAQSKIQVRRLRSANLIGGMAVLTAVSATGLMMDVGWFGLIAGLMLFVDLLFDFEQLRFLGLKLHRRSTVVLLSQRALPAFALIFSALWPGSLELVLCVTLFFMPILLITLSGGASIELEPLKKSTLQSSVGYWFSSLAVNLKQLEVVAAGFIAGPTIGATLGLGARIQNPLLILPVATSNVFVPEITGGKKISIEELTSKYKKINYHYSLAICLLSPFISWILVQILGKHYEEYLFFFIGMVCSSGILALSQVPLAGLTAVGRPAFGAWLGITSLVTELVLIICFGSFVPSAWYWVFPATYSVLIAASSSWLFKQQTSLLR